MPPLPLQYQGPDLAARFLTATAFRTGHTRRLIPTRANGQPAFGCYLPDPQASVVRAYGLMVLTLAQHKVSAVTWFGERSLLAHFGLPRTLPR